jgi:hypothetical protein
MGDTTSDTHNHDHDHAEEGPLHTAVRRYMSTPPDATNLGFLQLLNELCGLTGWTPPQASAQGPFDPVSFETAMGDVDMCVSCVPGGDACVYLACEFGPLPQQAALPAARRLLEINTLLHTHGRSAFCIDPQSGCVVCGCRFDGHALSASALFEGMQRLSEQAQLWRTGWFLEPGSAPDSLTPAAFA